MQVTGLAALMAYAMPRECADGDADPADPEHDPGQQHRQREPCPPPRPSSRDHTYGRGP
jgi:hypothetical protein